MEVSQVSASNIDPGDNHSDLQKHDRISESSTESDPWKDCFTINEGMLPATSEIAEIEEILNQSQRTDPTENFTEEPELTEAVKRRILSSTDEDSDIFEERRQDHKRLKKNRGLSPTIMNPYHHPDQVLNHVNDVITNKTMQSTPGTVILVSPIGENASSFSKSPIAIARGMKSEPFNKIIPKDLRINNRKNILTIELEEKDQNMMYILLQQTQLDKFKIKCYQPRKDIVSSGVIGPIELEVSDDEIKENIRCYDTEVVHVKRLFKFRNTESGHKEPSMTIRLDFTGSTLPKRAFIGNLSYIVRKYNTPPLRCYKCQRFGHTAGGCRKDDVCNICSGDHNMSECTNPIPKCANCHGRHPASYQNCPKNKAEIQAAKSQNSRSKSSYSYADKVMYGTRHTNEENINRSAMENNNVNRPLYQEKKDTAKRSFATQTPNIISDEVTNLKSYIGQIIESTILKFVSFIEEAFSLQLQKENPRERSLLIQNLMQNHFAMNIKEKSATTESENGDTNEFQSQVIVNKTLQRRKHTTNTPMQTAESVIEDRNDDQQSQVIVNQTLIRKQQETYNSMQIEESDLEDRSGDQSQIFVNHTLRREKHTITGAMQVTKPKISGKNGSQSQLVRNGEQKRNRRSSRISNKEVDPIIGKPGKLPGMKETTNKNKSTKNKTKQWQ